MTMKDLPDYTRQVIIRYEGGFIGLEELAVRLGSIVPWDLKGNIVLMEDFETALTEWRTSLISAGCSVARTEERKYSGSWSAKLYNVGGIDKRARLDRLLHYPGIGKYGAFARLCWTENCQEVYVSTYFHGETMYYEAEMRYDLPALTLKVRTTDGAFHNVDTNLDHCLSRYNWYPVLVTFDLSTGYYDKLYWADKEYDISDVALFLEEVAVATGGDIEIGSYSKVAGAFTVYADDIIIVKNVP